MEESARDVGYFDSWFGSRLSGRVSVDCGFDPGLVCEEQKSDPLTLIRGGIEAVTANERFDIVVVAVVLEHLSDVEV